ncbi:T6SS effector BTH_I2691 family protein [Halopseudomonas pelagia]|uniref:T6SS effector BTH_I2691 family protein n=1 Tax=Halopseudomonas pelagia TaxID=553151 RepID=UPI0030DB13DC|tara:strand:- start:304 stop:3750 length:3447 start_codon:yes stop_codon:yes gene_type:complete
MTKNMTMPQQDSAAKDSLKANFEDKPAGFTGQCPLQQQEVAIFPVRYAVDEAPQNPDEPAPNPIPVDWQDHQSLPRLHKRTYTLRQLRDGWVYVVNRTTNTLDEYQVQGSSFSKVSQGSAESGDQPNCAEATSHLLYPRDHELFLAYSSVEWTPYTRERMTDPELQSRWMRELDLASYARTLDAPHCAPLKQLAESVADIDAGQAVAGQRFDSTTTPSEPIDTDAQYKSALGSDTVLGSVPDQDSALFIALDDNLGILDDLSMQAAGPAIELAAFEAEHMHRLTIAEHVEMLAGSNFSELESEMGLTPDEFYQFKQKAQRYLTAKATHREDVQRPSQFSGISSSIESIRLENELNAEYGDNIASQLNALIDQWAARNDLRDQVRFEESQQFSFEKRQTLAVIQAALTPSLADLIAWLEHLGSDPLCLFHDQTDENQCLSLISNADAWLGLLTQDQSGQRWFAKEYAAPHTLLGLALYNFDAELASGIEQLANEFIDEPGISLAIASSVAKRTQEVSDVLSNETIRNSRMFQRLSQPAQQSFNTLIKVASTHFEKLWEGFEYKLLPAISSRLAPQWRTIGYVSITIAIQTRLDVIIPTLVKDPEYRQKLARWTRAELLLKQQIAAQQRVMRMGTSHDQRAADIHVRKLTSDLDKLTADMPQQILARGTIRAQTQSTDIQQRLIALQTLGRAELAAQMQLKARDYGAYISRVNDWVKNNFNRGFAGLITVLNIWNVHAAMIDARADGEWSQDDSLSVGTAVATMLSGLTALSLMPMWSKMAQLTGEATVKGNQVQGRLVDAAARYWNKGNAHHMALFKVFAIRAIAMSGLAVIASVAEGLQIWGELARSPATDEKIVNGAKLFGISGLGLIGAYQLYAASSAWLGGGAAGAVFAPWTLIAVAVFGSIILISSGILESIKREGFKLWLHRSRWSSSDSGYWSDTDEGHKDEMRALHEALMRPTILAQTFKNKLSDRYNPNRGGIWIKLVLPPDVAGHDINIHPIMVTEGGWLSADRQASHRSGMYANYFSQGNWVALDELAEWDSLEVRQYRHQTAAQYQAGDWRVWLVHLPHSKGMDRMEVEIHYPPALLQRPDNRGYRFSIDLNGMEAGSLHENPYVKGQVTEPNDSFKTLVLDSIPNRSRSNFTLGVI